MVLVVDGIGVVLERGSAAKPQTPGISLISSRAISLLYPPPRTASNTNCVKKRHKSYYTIARVDSGKMIWKFKCVDAPNILPLSLTEEAA